MPAQDSAQNNDTVKHNIVKYTIQKRHRIKKGCLKNSLFLCGVRILIPPNIHKLKNFSPSAAATVDGKYMYTKQYLQ